MPGVELMRMEIREENEGESCLDKFESLDLRERVKIIVTEQDRLK